MKEAQPTHASIDSVTREDADSVDFLTVGLPVIEDDEADSVSSLDQFLAEEDLLSLGSANVSYIFSLGERGVGVWGDKTYRGAT
jgi:hypothetical protein